MRRSKDIINYITFLLFTLVLFTSCGKNETPQALVYQKYNDPYTGIKFIYPQNWVLSVDPDKLKLFSSQDAINKFYDPSENTEPGSMFAIQVKPAGNNTTLNQFFAAISDSDKDLIPSYKNVSDFIIDGIPAKKISYTIPLGNKLSLTGEKYLVLSDSLGYIIDYKGFNDLYETYKPVCDSLIRSFAFPRKTGDDKMPSNQFDSFKNEFLSFAYPDNFDYTIDKLKGEILFSINTSGYRRDCSFQIDVLPSKGLTTEQAFDQNKKIYKFAADYGRTSIAGLNAPFINYTLVPKVKSRAYFLVKNDRLFRVTLNWYAPDEKNYLTIFEKMVNSITPN